MATITKLPRADGVVYKARVRRQGQSGQISKTFKTRSAAERWARKTESAIEQDDAGLTNEAQRHTLREAIKAFRLDKLPTLRPSTARAYSEHLDYWDNRLGHLRLCDVAPARITECRDQLKSEGRAAATVNRYLATLASVLTFAVKDRHWLKVSPMSGVAKLKEDNAVTRFLTKGELRRLLDACEASASPDLRLAVILSITTGARQGEILGLRWRDIDLERGILHLRVGNETETKGGARSLPIAPPAVPLLQDRRQALLGRSDDADTLGERLVFPSRRSQSKPVQLRQPWETALKRAEIEDFRWHDLRHSAASFMAKQGATLLEIGAVLGHRSANTTKRYTHLTEEATHSLVRGMAETILGGDEA